MTVRLVSRKLLSVFSAVIVVAIATPLAVSVFLNNQNNNADPAALITLGNAQSFECDTLVYLAQNQGFFAQNGIEVKIENYTSGAAAVNDLLAGKLDIAATAEFPIVRNVFENENISTIACIGKFQLQELIGRKDHGINGIADLQGKRIGVPLGTISEFYIGRFLELNGMSLQSVNFVNVNPAESVSAIANGSLDALVIWQPYAFNAKEELGSNSVVWQVQSSQRLYIAEVARNDWIVQHPDIVKRFLKALVQAEDYYIRNTAHAMDEMQQNLNYTDEYMDAIWGRNEFSLSLEQTFILAMEDEARWLIANNLTNSKNIPNFANFVYFDGLEETKPESINVIR